MAAPRTVVMATGLVLTLLPAALPACTFDNAGNPIDAAVADASSVDAPMPADAAPADASADATPKVADDVLAGLGPAVLATATDARAWARRGSAPEVFFTAYLAVHEAEQRLLAGDTCPVVVSNGNVKTYTGGCTDAKGEVWSGVATLLGPVVSSIPGSVTYADFGHTGTTTCGASMMLATETRYTGKVVRGSALPALPIVVDLKLRETRATAACALETADFGIDYQMTVDTSGDTDNNGTPDTRTWNGSGRLGKASGENAGLIAATTTSEITGEACGSEALAGTSQLSSDGHVVEIGYDGTTDCDSMSTVTWSLDGVAQGELTGVICTLSPPGARTRGTGGAAALLLGLLLVAGERRRRRRDRDGGR
jgi:hypothetical protein